MMSLHPRASCRQGQNRRRRRQQEAVDAHTHQAHHCEQRGRTRGAALTFSPEVASLLRSKGLEVRELTPEKLSRVIEIEKASFPEDEAATPERLQFRLTNAKSFFLEGSLSSGDMVGYVCGTSSKGAELSHESMMKHDPDGSTLCIHSVAIHEKLRRRGYATALLKAYVDKVAVTEPGVKRVCLISKAGLLGMYASCGFSMKGLSQVALGKDPWFEMSIDLDSTEPRLLRFLQVDAFTEKAFCGNPAAVFFTHEGGNEDWMQKVAKEMNLSETCFLESKTDLEPMYSLRWFTPGGEVRLCGHATLGAAHALWEEGRVDSSVPIKFSTASGVLTCRRDEKGWVSMDFPAEVVGPPLEAEDESRRAIVEALCLEQESVLFVGRNRHDIMVEITPEAFADLQPDIRLLVAIETRGVIVTCATNQNDGDNHGIGTEGVDFRSRFFAPRLGIDEDPVTGSAHCCLGPYWSSKLGRDYLVGYQASPRGGKVRVAIGRGAENGRVELKGKAVTIIQGLFRR